MRSGEGGVCRLHERCVFLRGVKLHRRPRDPRASFNAQGPMTTTSRVVPCLEIVIMLLLANAAGPLTRSLVSLQLAPSPTRVFAVGIEHTLDVAVQRPQHTDPRMHQRPAILRSHDQRLDGGLPLRAFVFGLRQPRDVIGGILERDELVSAWQRDRIVEFPFPAFFNHLIAAQSDVFLAAASLH
jgi:hypothetical protein